VKALTVRASSLAELFDCPQRWASIHIEGKRGWNSGPAWLGTSMHHGTAAYDQSRIELQPILVEDATDLTIHMIDHPEEEVRWDNKGITQREARKLASILVPDYCNRISPLYTFETVELKLDPVTIEVDDVSITLTGTADRIRVQYDEPTRAELTYHNLLTPDETPWWAEPARGVCDVKSGRSVIRNGVVQTDKHVAQLGTYELLEVMIAKQTAKEMTLPAQILALPTNGDIACGVGEMERPSRVLLGEGNHKGLLRAAAKMAEHEIFYGNPKSMLCGPKYCPVYPCWWTGKKNG